MFSAVVFYVVPDAKGVARKGVELCFERVEVAPSPLALQLHTV